MTIQTATPKQAAQIKLYEAQGYTYEKRESDTVYMVLGAARIAITWNGEVRRG